MTRRIEIVATPEFEGDLARLMERRGIESPTEAIRLAVHETAETQTLPKTWDGLLGAFRDFPERPREEWIEEDDLWS